MKNLHPNQIVFPFYLEMEKPSMLFFEEEAGSRGYTKIAGVDEAGRGPLAGPLVVASCIVPKGLILDQVNDSKKLTPRIRQDLYTKICSHPDIIYSIEVISPEQIDELNILQATFFGMRESVESLSTAPDYILVDGPHSPFPPSKSKAIVKGDSLSHSIACASILAKVTRDTIMEGYDLQWPEYGFAKHKGYPTKQHRDLLQKIGPCPIHRRSYAPVLEASLAFQ